MNLLRSNKQFNPIKTRNEYIHFNTVYLFLISDNLVSNKDGNINA